MSGKGCTSGCLGIIGASLVLSAAHGMLIAELGVAPGVFLLAMGAVPLWMAWSLYTSSLQDLRAQAERLQRERERAVLMVAAQNEGRVTAGLLVATTGSFTIAQAKTLLDEMLADGHCALESDDAGNLFYQFDLGHLAGGGPAHHTRSTSRSQRRMTGEDDDNLLNAGR